MSLMERRRALMAGTGRNVPNNFVPGTYTRGSSVFVVDSDGYITVSSWPKGWDDDVGIPFYRSFQVKTGDIVKISVTCLSGSVSKSFLAYIGPFNKSLDKGFWPANNATVKDGLRESSFSGSATYDMDCTVLRMENNVDGLTFTNWKIKIEIFVNGVRVIPEA